MNVEIGTKAAPFPEKEYINGIFVAEHQPNSWNTFLTYCIWKMKCGDFYGTRKIKSSALFCVFWMSSSFWMSVIARSTSAAADLFVEQDIHNALYL